MRYFLKYRKLTYKRYKKEEDCVIDSTIRKESITRTILEQVLNRDDVEFFINNLNNLDLSLTNMSNFDVRH